MSSEKNSILALKCARLKLRPNNVPDELPGRESEYKRIYGKVRSAIEQFSGCCICISGQAGTGKTATVECVMDNLKKEVSEVSEMSFHLVKINGMELNSPEELYTILWKQLTGVIVNSSDAKKLLDARFKAKSEPDSVESIAKEKRQVAYNLLDWTARFDLFFILIAITSDDSLADSLSDSCNSRLLDKLVFKPYTKNELITIADKCYECTHIFGKDVIDVAASITTSGTQDIKTFISICRDSIDILESNYKKNPKINLIVTNEIVQKAIYRLSNPYKDYIKRCSTHEKMFLLALLTAKDKNINDSPIQVKDVVPLYIKLCKNKFIEVPKESDILNIAYNLATSSYIIMDPSKDIYTPVNFNGTIKFKIK
nr:12638_t:CDS:2 [Entrophospora candida]